MCIFLSQKMREAKNSRQTQNLPLTQAPDQKKKQQILKTNKGPDKTGSGRTGRMPLRIINIIHCGIPSVFYFGIFLPSVHILQNSAYSITE